MDPWVSLLGAVLVYFGRALGDPDPQERGVGSAGCLLHPSCWGLPQHLKKPNKHPQSPSPPSRLDAAGTLLHASGRPA